VAPFDREEGSSDASNDEAAGTGPSNGERSQARSLRPDRPIVDGSPAADRPGPYPAKNETRPETETDRDEAEHRPENPRRRQEAPDGRRPRPPGGARVVEQTDEEAEGGARPHLVPTVAGDERRAPPGNPAEPGQAPDCDDDERLATSARPVRPRRSKGP
jgi:hypothetical protein